MFRFFLKQISSTSLQSHSFENGLKTELQKGSIRSQVMIYLPDYRVSETIFKDSTEKVFAWRFVFRVQIKDKLPVLLRRKIWRLYHRILAQNPENHELSY